MKTGQQLLGKQNYTWIPCKNLSVIWADAQQPFNEAHAKSIADNFDPDLLQPLAVTKPNGEGVYHVVDGQHRKAAIEMWGGLDQRAPCIILDAGDPARAAKLFVELNTQRRRPTPLTIFKVKVTAGEQTEVEVNKIVRAAGYAVGDRAGTRNISAVAALVSVYKRHGGEILADTLKLIQATWGMDTNAVVAPIIRGYGAFLAEYKHEANWQRMKEVIAKKWTPGRFLANAKSAREVSGTGTLEEAVKGVLINYYNKGARKRLKPSEKKDGKTSR